MKLTKQTVYLPVSDFNNSERAICTIVVTDLYGDKVVEIEGYFFTPEQLNQLLSDVIKDSLDTAAENAYVEYIDLQTDEKMYSQMMMLEQM